MLGSTAEKLARKLSLNHSSFVETLLLPVRNLLLRPCNSDITSRDSKNKLGLSKGSRSTGSRERRCPLNTTGKVSDEVHATQHSTLEKHSLTSTAYCIESAGCKTEDIVLSTLSSKQELKLIEVKYQSELISTRLLKNIAFSAIAHKMVDGGGDTIKNEEGNEDDEMNKDKENAGNGYETSPTNIYVGRLAPSPSGYMHGN